VASAASFNNHQIMSSFVNEPCQATIYFNEQQNIDHVDIDDLLDVLRDDQGKIGDYKNPNSSLPKKDGKIQGRARHWLGSD
jgi:hypothetical protein